MSSVLNTLRVCAVSVFVMHSGSLCIWKKSIHLNNCSSKNAPLDLPKELRKSEIFLILHVITSMYSLFAQSLSIGFWSSFGFGGPDILNYFHFRVSRFVTSILVGQQVLNKPIEIRFVNERTDTVISNFIRSYWPMKNQLRKRQQAE